MTAEAFRCADAADLRNEPLYGTASFVRRWLLIEQPGAWGRHALLSSGVPRAVASELRQRARKAGIRVVLIRRGARFAAEQRTCYFVRTEADGVYQAELSVDSVDELLDIDLSPLAGGGSIAEAEERSEPIFLVCTHGRHDACCAIRGNQVSRVACAEPGLDAWECSHIGGDRFAANLVCFPHGIYYGRVGVGDVVGLMHAYANDALSLEHYRGRACYPFALQAAEYFARAESGALAPDGVRLAAASRTASGLSASFVIDGSRLADVEVAVAVGEEHRLTCGSRVREPIPQYHLVSCALRAV